jgi:hypothetical protein
VAGGRFGLNCEADGQSGFTESEACSLPPDLKNKTQIEQPIFEANIVGSPAPSFPGICGGRTGHWPAGSPGAFGGRDGPARR